MLYVVTRRVPRVEEHRELAEAVGWGDAFWWEAQPQSLAGSVCGVVVHDEHGTLAGMGRVVGDGAFYFYLQDLAVRPDHQRKGLGRIIVERLTAQIEEIAPGPCFVGIFATPQAQRLCQELGWEARDKLGMWRVVRDGGGTGTTIPGSTLHN